MIFTIFFWFFAGLFGLKILWNILTPFSLARGLLKDCAKKTGGVTLMPFVEIALLIILIVFSAFSGNSAWFYRPLQVAFWGGVIIVGSYILFIVLGISLGWLVSQIKKRRA